MKPSVLFLDLASTKAYDYQSLEQDVVGGTEGTIIRVAEQLAQTFSVVVVQATRQTVVTSPNGVIYSPLLTSYYKENWIAIIHLRRPWFALNYYEVFPKVPTWVWLHDLVVFSFIPLFRSLAEKEIGFITVSRSHAAQLEYLYKMAKNTPIYPKIRTLYNPIADDLEPDQTPVDYNQLLYMSSPYKGLPSTIELFKKAREQNPDFKLYVTGLSHAAPVQVNHIEGVIQLGPLKHQENLNLTRRSLAVLYPSNPSFPETFGLVYAESNAVGTPVLTYDTGSAKEVLNGDLQIIPYGQAQSYVDRLMDWYRGQRPQVEGKKEYRLSNVILEWHKLLFNQD